VANNWHPNHIEHLVELYSKTRKSAEAMREAVNRRFGTTYSRNSIIGKINRLGLRDKFPEAAKHRAEANTGGSSKHDGSRQEGKAARRPPSLPRVVAFANPILEKQFAPVHLAEPVDFNKDRISHPYGPISIYELRDNTCRWPLGEMKDLPPYRYCGCRTAPDKPYCAEHVRRGYGSNSFNQHSASTRPSYVSHARRR
jgi:GcrA cell cycle regulator